MTTKDPALKKYSAGWRAHLSIYKFNAKKRGLPFDLTPAQVDVLFAGNCAYCGDGPETRRFCTHNKNPYEITASGLDRIDSSLGYTLENTTSACKSCNLAKGILGADEFIRKSKQIAAKNS